MEDKNTSEGFWTKTKSRKFILALLSLIGVFTALFTGFISGTEVIAALGTIFTFYGASSAVEKSINKRP